MEKELARLDGLGQAELVRRGDAKPIELVDAAIERIERLNPTLNAVVFPLFDQARESARHESQLARGPFRGVPYLLKDLLAAYSGAPLTGGSAYFKDYRPPFDSVVVSRLKRAGLIIVGKTNTPELGLVATTEPRLFGATRNPWNPERTPGGSSGGAAAAVASGMVPMAHANDGGGSIRIPASCCGVFGLKPTRGRISLGPAVGDLMGGWAVEHAVTISVRDSAALLDATAGPSAGDPYWAAPPARPFLDEVGAAPGRLRIAFAKMAAIGTPVHPDCVRAVEDAARVCADLGHEVAEDFPKLDGEMLVRMFGIVWAASCASGIDGAATQIGKPPSEDQFEPLTWFTYQMGRRISASDYLLAQGWLQLVSRGVAQFMEQYDLLLTPTLGSPPVPLGWFQSPPHDPLLVQRRMMEFDAFPPLSNITGQPAMSVPLDWNGEGLPVGVHFAGRYGDEATLFRLAAQLEAARPWAGRRPPLSVFS
ncbi:MAG: amidase [Terriglobia bacterium]